MLKNKTQFVSTGKDMSFYSMSSKRFTPNIVLQDYEDTKDIAEFQGLDCPKDEDCGDVILDGTNGPAILQTYNKIDRQASSKIVDVITEIEGDGTLDVHIGGRIRNGSNIIASYSPKITTPNLPQLFFGEMKTYVVTGGKLKIHFSRKLDDFQNQTVGGKGFISSFNYGHFHNQDSYSQIFAPENSKIRVKIRDIDLNSASKLTITGYKNDTVVYTETINYDQPNFSVDLASKTINDYFYGDKMNVHYHTNPFEKNNGFYMEFFVEKSTSINFTLLNFVLMFVLFWY